MANQQNKAKGLYVHIPFCKSKCVYCDFCSVAGYSHLFTTYVDALKKEILLYRNIAKDYEFNTIFVGGGTPSILGGKLITDIFNLIKSNFNILPNAEITIEANPDSFTEEFAHKISLLGVNRISIGLQSASDELLKNLGRPHDYNDFCRAYSIATKYFDNVNVDLMLGIEGQTLDDVKNTLSSLLLKNPQHFSVYGLILEKGTPLYRKVKNGIAHLPDVDQTADMYDYVVDTLSKHGYNRYEVSNFAQKGFECKHNLNYWDRGEYLGLGLSAHGFIDGVRYSNLKIFDRYFAKLNEDALPIATKTKISKKDACFEFVFLNLRKTDGFNVNDFKSATGKDFFEVYQQPFDELLKKGLIDYIDGKIKIKSKYFYVMNDILVEFAL
ncbi:MAG: radical SAM family heme chaperone HemW [Clostridia bacterium]|nr:radical SAM family heme chaperone HemW [Clostridia bacterium]